VYSRQIAPSAIIRQPCLKPRACLQEFSCVIFDPLKETTWPGGAKYVLGAINHFSNYIWLLAFPNKKAIVSTISVLTDIKNLNSDLHDGRTFLADGQVRL
jgi:hypothetical protein